MDGALRGVPAGGRGPPGISAGWARASRRHFSASPETRPLLRPAARLSLPEGRASQSQWSPPPHGVHPRPSPGKSLAPGCPVGSARGDSRPCGMGGPAPRATPRAGREGSGGDGQWGWALSFGRDRALAAEGAEGRARCRGPTRRWGGENSGPLPPDLRVAVGLGEGRLECHLAGIVGRPGRDLQAS